MDERTLAERFPIGKSVTTKVVVVGTTRNGIVRGYVTGYPGVEFVVVEFARGLVALPPEELVRNDLKHPRCPSCRCEKEPPLQPRRREVVRAVREFEDDLDEEEEDLG